MKKILLTLIVLFCIKASAQNFFPTMPGDAYQFQIINIYESPIWHTETFYEKSFATEYFYLNQTYVKVWDKYFRKDSTTNKLYILLNGEEKLACDFNKSTGETDTLYFSGGLGVYTYTQSSYNIFGQEKLVKEIYISNLPFKTSYQFVDGIGFYRSENTFQDPYNGYYKYHTAISAIIDSLVYNAFTLDIIPNFPTDMSPTISNYNIPVGITTPYPGLVNYLAANVVVYGSGNVIYTNTFQGNIDLESVTINVSRSILSQADSVGFQIVCKDESIFNNEVFFPSENYHFVPVVSEFAWALLAPNLYVPIPQTMKFFTQNNGIIFGKTQSVPDPPYGINNRTIDGGKNFSSTTTNIDQAYINEIINTNENTAYMLLSIWGVEKTTDIGSSWSRVLNLLYGYSISFINNYTGWVSGCIAGGTNGIRKLFRTIDGGNNWESFNTPQQEILSLINFINISDGYAVSELGKFYNTIDGGESWTFTNATITNQKKLNMFQNGNGWLVGNGIWRTQDCGNTWNQQYEGNFVDAYFFDKDKGWVIGAVNGNKILLHTNDGGLNWNSVDVHETGGDYLYIDFVDETHGWIYSANKKLLRTTNGGITFIEDERFSSEQTTEFTLLQNYPNPFNPRTMISYQIPKACEVTLKVFDVLGREVATLVNEYKNAGSYEIEFNPESSIRHPASGIYFYQLTVGEFVETKKMLLIK